MKFNLSKETITSEIINPKFSTSLEESENSLIASKATARLENFISENNLEELNYSEQATKVRQFLDQTVEQLQQLTLENSIEESAKTERHVLRLEIEVIAKKLHELHELVNFMNKIDESERFLINKIR